MATFSKYKEMAIEAGKRILKVLEFGTKTADECAPFGIDSVPIKDMTAIYMNTSNNSESVIVGYINTNQLAAEGETRLFSVDASGALKAFVWLKANGNIEINGNAYNSVRFEPLKTGLNNQDALINTELAKIATAIGTLGGVYVPATVTTNVDAAKNDTVKLS